MKRTRWITVLAGVVATSALGVPAASAADDPCLKTPATGWWYGGGLPPPPPPVLTTRATVAAVFITNSEPFPDCSGTTATAQKADGTLRRTVPLDTGDSTGSPPQVFAIGFVPIPLANGAGDWVVTGIQHAGGSLAVSVPFPHLPRNVDNAAAAADGLQPRPDHTDRDGRALYAYWCTSSVGRASRRHLPPSRDR